MNKLMHSTNMTGQSIVDRALAAKYTVSGQSLAKVICKATTEEIMGPKRKHLDYLLHCTNEPNISIPQMANLLIERTQSGHWVVVFKALVTVHNLMNYGNERFTQYLASSNSSFNLSNFTERSGNQGYDMSAYVRRYSKYLNEKAYSYRLMAFDFCKVKRGKDDGFLRTMNTEKLLKTLPVLQQQLDSLIEFDVTANELTNGVINSAFMLLFKDLIRLFACYNDGIINLLEKYFDMNKKNAKEALDVYKKFLARMDRTCEFLKVAETVGIDKGDIPDLAKAPSSLLDALEQHLASLEGKKTATAVTLKPGQGISATISSYAAQSQAGAAPGAGASISNISEEERQKILEEEQRQLDQMKQQRLRQMEASGKTTISPPTSNPLIKPSPLNSPQTHNPEISRMAPVNNSQPLDDPFLLNLDPLPNSGLDPMAHNFNAPTATHATFNPFGSGLPFQQQPQAVSQGWATPIYSIPNASKPPQPFGNNFGTEPNFATAFVPQNNSQPTGGARYDNFGEILKPYNATQNQTASLNKSSTAASEGSKLIQPDLDTSLACLAGNLSILPSGQIKKTEHQWTNKPTEKKLTGYGPTWNTPPQMGQTWNPAWPNQQSMMVNNNIPAYAIPILFSSPPQWNMQSQHMMPNQMLPSQPTNMNDFSAQQNNWASRPQSNNPSASVNDPFGAL